LRIFFFAYQENKTSLATDAILTDGDGLRARATPMPASLTSVSDVDKARLEAVREQVNKIMQRDAKVKDESDLYNKLLKQVCALPLAVARFSPAVNSCKTWRKLMLRHHPPRPVAVYRQRLAGC
jgi:hypothetical protein